MLQICGKYSLVKMHGVEVDVLINDIVDEEEAVIATFVVFDWHLMAIHVESFNQVRDHQALEEGVT